MNRTKPEQRARVLQLLCEGMSIRAIERTTGVTKQTVTQLLNDAGKALGAYQDRAFRNLSTRRVQVDEIWAFTYAKQRNVATAKAAPDWAGDTWTWIGIDADTKLVMSWLVGGRDGEYAMAFMDDLASRLTRHVSTSYVERQNLTMRMHMRRFTRLTNGFSKKVENHANAVALHFAYYNLVKVHKTLRMTPAMAAGVTDRLWEMADLVAVIEAAEPKPGKRGPYRKKTCTPNI
jgi:IS1 family transposase